MCQFLDFMDSPSYTYMKWPLIHSLQFPQIKFLNDSFCRPKIMTIKNADDSIFLDTMILSNLTLKT